MRAISVILSVLISTLFISCKEKNSIKKILKTDDWLFEIAHNNKYQVQISYTSVNILDGSLTTHNFKVSENQYFYPASVVKLPVAILALERLNELKQIYPSLNSETDLITLASRELQTESKVDTTNQSQRPNIKRYIEKSLVVSENNSYNRLYEFLGVDYINDKLREKGIFSNGSVINHRLALGGFNLDENRYTNSLSFLLNDSIIFQQSSKKSSVFKHDISNSKRGNGYIDSNGQLISDSFDFSEKNYIHIADMEGILMRLFYPEKFKEYARFQLSNDDYAFLKKTLSAYPKDYAFYSDRNLYPDNYVKFFMIGDSDELLPTHIKIYNKVGYAYGYATDCSYIEDTKNGVAFFLTATIHVNENGIFNDDTYEYESIGIPFLAKLGRLIYQHELSNKQ